MMLRDNKTAAAFLVTDPVTHETWRVDPNRWLTARQQRIMGEWILSQ